MAKDLNKQYEPSSHRLEKAYKEGQFALSKDLLQAGFLGAVWVLLHVLSYVISDLLQMCIECISGRYVDNISYSISRFCMFVFFVFAPIGILLSFAQTKFACIPSLVMPKLSRLGSTAKHIFSMHGIVDFLKSIAKLTILLMSIYFSFYRKEWMCTDYITGYTILWDSLVSAIKLLFFLNLLFGILDYFLQRFRHRANLKMSFFDIKEETKELEGDVQTKMHIRSMYKKLIGKRAAIQKAAVIIVNPTHYAVALSYQDGKTAVLAKGFEGSAFDIVNLAVRCNIPIVKAPSVARSIYNNVPLLGVVDSTYHSDIKYIMKAAQDILTKSFA